MSDVGLIVPLRSFARAKSRLRAVPGLDVDRLVEELARAVVLAARPRDTVVATDDVGVARWARGLGAAVVLAPPGLNAAVEAAYRELGDATDVAVVAHGDLADPAGLGDFCPDVGVTVVADHRGTGTTVLAVPTGVGFRFSFGPSSRTLHELEAARLELPWRTVTDSPWRFDVDEPNDLERLVP
ncbi:MAG TPA: hypothetical protein PLS29_05640 [Acidimicrobiales bacterium]|nr:hypothetical protein [Acidimicrobiales bacterium]